MTPIQVFASVRMPLPTTVIANSKDDTGNGIANEVNALEGGYDDIVSGNCRWCENGSEH
jgi:hypothetical protein